MTGPDPRKAALFEQYGRMFPNESDEEIAARVNKLFAGATRDATNVKPSPTLQPAPVPVTGPDAKKAAMFEYYAKMYPSESDEQLTQRTRTFFLEGMDNPPFIAPEYQKPEPGPDPMTIGAASKGNIFRSRARQDILGGKIKGNVLEETVAGMIGGLTGAIGAATEDPVAFAKNLGETAKNVPMSMAKGLIDNLAVNPVQLAFDAISEDYNLTNEERLNKAANFLITAASLTVAGKIMPSKSMARFRNGIGELPSVMTRAGEFAKQSVAQSVTLGAAQAAVESKTPSEFGQKLYSYSISTLPFALALDVGFGFAGLKKDIQSHIEAKEAIHATYKVQATHDIANEINDVRESMAPLVKSQELKQQAGLEADPEVQKDINKHIARIEFLNGEVDKIANSTTADIPEHLDDLRKISLKLPDKAKLLEYDDLVDELSSTDNITSEHVESVRSLSEEDAAKLNALRTKLFEQNQKGHGTDGSVKLEQNLHYVNDIIDDEIRAKNKPEPVVAQENTKRKVIAIDDAIGAKLLEDVYDPSRLDPVTGDVSLIAKAGSEVTKDVIDQIMDAGIEAARTDKGIIGYRITKESSEGLDLRTGMPTGKTVRYDVGQEPGSMGFLPEDTWRRNNYMIGSLDKINERYISSDEALGAKLVEDIVDYGELHTRDEAVDSYEGHPEYKPLEGDLPFLEETKPSSGPRVLYKKGEKVTPEMLRNIKKIQENKAFVRTNKGVWSINPDPFHLQPGEFIEGTWIVDQLPDARIRVSSDGNPEGFYFNNKVDANQFLKTAHAPPPIDFDIPKPPEMPPPSGGANPPQPPPPKPHEAIHTPQPLTPFGKKLAAFTGVVRDITNRVGLWGQHDNLFDTMFVPYVYEPVQYIKQKSVHAKEKVFKVIDNLIISRVHKMKTDRLKLVNEHAATNSLMDIVTGFADNRKISDPDRATVVMMMKNKFGIDVDAADVAITPTELAFAEGLSANGSDIKQAISIAGTLRDMKRESDMVWKQTEATTQGGNRFSLKNAKKNHDMNARQAIDVMLFDTKASKETIKSAMDIEQILDRYTGRDASYHAVTLLADAIQAKALTRGEFATKHGMTPEEVKLSDDIRMVQDVVSRTGRGTDVKLLNSLKRHLALFGDTPKSLKGIAVDGATNRHFNAVKNDNYDLENPVNNLLNHTSSTVDYNHGLQAAVKRAEIALKEEVKKIPNKKISAAMLRDGRAYLAEIMGSKNREVALTAAYISEAGSQIGKKVNENALNEFVSTAVTGYSGINLGGRVGLVARDIVQSLNNYYIRFDRSLFNQLTPDIMKRIQLLREEGIVPTMSGSYHISGSEAELAAIAKLEKGFREFVDKGANFGIHASGQEFVFELVHGLTYLDRMDAVGNGLMKLHKGDITKEALYKELKMSTYHSSVQKHFDSMVSLGHFEEATKYLAQKTSNEHGVIYGFANLPTKWRSTIGRVAGQYNTWTTWQRSLYTQLIQGAGSSKERAGVIGRIVATQAATYAASKVTGLKAGPWMLHNSFLPQLGPMVATYESWMDPTETTDFNDPGDIAKKAITQIGVAADIFRAIEANEKGFNPVHTAMRLFAFPMEKTERSLLDKMMGYYPHLAAKRGAFNSFLNMVTGERGN